MSNKNCDKWSPEKQRFTLLQNPNHIPPRIIQIEHSLIKKHITGGIILKIMASHPTNASPFDWA